MTNKTILDIIDASVKGTIDSEQAEFQAEGIDPYSPEAATHYLAWTRYDVAVILGLLTSMEMRTNRYLLSLNVAAWLLVIELFRRSIR